MISVYQGFSDISGKISFIKTTSPPKSVQPLHKFQVKYFMGKLSLTVKKFIKISHLKKDQHFCSFSMYPQGKMNRMVPGVPFIGIRCPPVISVPESCTSARGEIAGNDFISVQDETCTQCRVFCKQHPLQGKGIRPLQMPHIRDSR